MKGNHILASTGKPKKNRHNTVTQKRLIGRTNTEVIEVNGTKCTALIDSGSVILSMCSKFYEQQFSHVELNPIEDVFPDGLSYLHNHVMTNTMIKIIMIDVIITTMRVVHIHMSAIDVTARNQTVILDMVATMMTTDVNIMDIIQTMIAKDVTMMFTIHLNNTVVTTVALMVHIEMKLAIQEISTHGNIMTLQ